MFHFGWQPISPISNCYWINSFLLLDGMRTKEEKFLFAYYYTKLFFLLLDGLPTEMEQLATPLAQQPLLYLELPFSKIGWQTK